MPLTTNTTPFWDDYDEKKQYYRILFRPGYPVQARELTQLQTSLQKQIERHGKHMFAHGSRVIGGEYSYNKCRYIKLADYVQNDTTKSLVDVNDVFSKTALQGARLVLDTASLATSGPGNYTIGPDNIPMHEDGRQPTADIILVSEREGSDPPTILLNYTSGDEFQANDYIRAVHSDTALFGGVGNFHAVVNSSPSSTANAIGFASYASIANGVYFVTTSTGGYFAYTPKQRIILEKYNNKPTWKIGLKITESIVDEVEDATLYDNARGVYQNYAPGAHRLKIALDLAKDPSGDGVAINPESSKDFVELLRLTGGIKAYGKPNQDPIYSILGEVLSDRTFDESGNYVVNDFQCYVEEASDPPDGRLKVILRPVAGKASAKAYIQGRKYEQTEPWIKYINKARKTNFIREHAASTRTGPYLTVKTLQVQETASGVSGARLAGMPFWDLHSCNTNCVDVSGTANKYNSTLVGRFRIRSIHNGKQENANTHQIYFTEYTGSPAITGNFQAAPGDTDLTFNADGSPSPSEVSVVTVQSGTTSSEAPNAYAGAIIKITSTEENTQNNYVGQTRSIIKSVYNSGGTDLYLDMPFAQPGANSGPNGFPGQGETYSLSLGLKAAGTGNSCIVESSVGPDGTGPLVPASIRTANAEIIAGITHTANMNPIMGGTGATYSATLLSHTGTGGGLVANSFSPTVTGSDIVMYATYNKSIAAGSGYAEFNPTDFREGSSYSISTFATIQKTRWTIINETTGEVVNPQDFTLDGTSSAPKVRVSGAKIVDGHKIRAITPVQLTGILPKSKTLVIGNNTKWDVAAPITTDRVTNGHVVFTSPNQTAGGKDNLGMIDVHKIREIYDTGRPNYVANGHTIGVNANKVTRNYTLDTGQKEDMYDYASLILNPGARPPKGQLVAIVDWFTHSTEDADNFGFFSTDSYKTSVGLDGLPSFSTNAGRRINLKDYLDFRPSRSMNVETWASTGEGPYTTHNAGAAANTSYFLPIVANPTATDALGSSGIAIFVPDPLAGAAFFDMQFFAPRMDKIILSLQKDTSTDTDSGFIRIVSGSEDQVPPTRPLVTEQDMVLFTLGIPAYTFSAKHVNIEKSNNRRWTMRDITGLNDKIKRLEYYSSLNLMEQELNNINIYDAEGNFERFKNGFLVDTFHMGTAVADVGTPGAPNLDFQAAIGKGVLRPAVEQENISLEPREQDSSHVQVSWGDNGSVIHLPYSINRGVSSTGTVQDFAQLNATGDGAENINPFQVQNFQGGLKCSPASDNWRSTVDTPEPLVIDTTGALSAMRTLVDTMNNRMGGSMTVWGDWDENWYGNPENVTNMNSVTEALDENAAIVMARLTVPNQPQGGGGQTVALGGSWHDLGDGNYSLSTGDYWPQSSKTSYEGRLSPGVTTPSGNYSLTSTDYITGRAGYNPYGKETEGGYNITQPVSTHVFDDEVTRTVYSGNQSRSGTQTILNINTDTVEIGEFTINTSTAQFMRPIEIKFAAQSIKPRTKFYPFFDNVPILNYVERANELQVNRQTYGKEGYSKYNFRAAINQQEKIMDWGGGGGEGLAIGSTATTLFLVSANGSFKTNNQLRGDISDYGAVHTEYITVDSYKSYSGQVQSAATGGELHLDDSAADSGSWYPTGIGTGVNTGGAGASVGGHRAYLQDWGSQDTDLYGKTIYITEGRGYGQSGTIVSFSNTTNKVTIGNPVTGLATSWAVTPNTDSRYSIGDPMSSKYGSLYGSFHVPNYNWANRLEEASLEGSTSSDSEIWDPNNAESDTKTNDLVRFPTGTHILALRDHATDTTFVEGGLHSQAKANFQAAGVIETRQKWTQDVYSISTHTTPVTESRPAVHSTTELTGEKIEVGARGILGAICHLDPLAQSFIVDPEKHPEGVFVDSVDLWFKTKHDTSGETDLAVTCQIRPTIGGVPHGGIILGSTVLNSDEINVSTGTLEDLPDSSSTSSNMTTFEFGRPIHLMAGQEYAIVLLSDSIEYEVWTAVVGSDKVGTGGTTGISAITIGSQPHTGSLFKSQNGSTWVPEPNQDMMFRLNVCIFDTSRVGTMLWRTQNTMSHYTPSITRVPNAMGRPHWGTSRPQPSSQTWGPAGYKVWNKDFLYDRFRIDTPMVDFGSTFSSFQYFSATEGATEITEIGSVDPTTGWRNVQLRADVLPEIYSSQGVPQRLAILKNKEGSFILKGTISSENKDVSPMVNQERLSLTMMKNIINNGELYANTWPTNYVLLDSVNSGTEVGGGFAITPGEGYSAGDVVTFRTERLADTDPLRIGTGATGTLLVNTMGSIVGVTLTNAGNTYLHAPVITITSPGGGTGGVIEYIGEDSARGPGNFLARYMTRRVVLADGFDSKDLLVYLTASQRQGTKVHVYAKVRSKEDTEPFDSKKWQLMARGQSYGEELTDHESQYRELQFGGPGAIEYPFAYTIGDEASGGDRFNTFNEFAIKIVMQSDNALRVPVVKNLRSIAVD